MSCVSKIEMQIKDLDAFKKACAELGLVFQEGKQQYRIHGRSVACEHAVTRDGWSYDIGLVRANYDEKSQRVVEDSSSDYFMLGLDTWGNAGRLVTGVVGRKCDLLIDAYGRHAVRNKAAQMGWSLTEELQEDGSTLFEVTKPSYQQEQQGSW